jgi:hypothetical protein
LGSDSNTSNFRHVALSKFRLFLLLDTPFDKNSNLISVADPHHLDADPDPAFHFDTDSDPDPTFHSDADGTFQFEEDPEPDPIPLTFPQIWTLLCFKITL